VISPIKFMRGAFQGVASSCDVGANMFLHEPFPSKELMSCFSVLDQFQEVEIGVPVLGEKYLFIGEQLVAVVIIATRREPERILSSSLLRRIKVDKSGH
jgi:hypothetical protein